MIAKAMQDAINAHTGVEIYSAHLYLSMSAYCESINLKGFARWMRMQSHEEMGHAMKMFDYLVTRGGRVVLEAIEQPPTDFNSPRRVFEQVLEHEQKITCKIYGLYEMAVGEKDYATQNLLQWFIAEQVEEEAAASEYLEKLRMIGDSSNAIFMVDKELGKRGQ